MKYIDFQIIANMPDIQIKWYAYILVSIILPIYSIAGVLPGEG